MKILLVNHFPLEGSGSGTYTRNLALHLAKRGHSVCVVFPENEQPPELDGVQLRQVRFSRYVPQVGALPFNFPCFTTHPRSVTTFADLDGGELAQYLTAFDAAITQAVEEFRPDIIHAQHIWCLAWLAAKHGVPTVVTTHGTDLMGCEKWREFRGFAELAAKSCKRVIAVSGDNMRALHRALPHTAGKTVMLRNGYNEDVFFPVEADKKALMDELGIEYNGEQIVLFVGKLTAFKGVDTLLRAAKLYEGLEKGAHTDAHRRQRRGAQAARSAQRRPRAQRHTLPRTQKSGYAPPPVQLGGRARRAVAPRAVRARRGGGDGVRAARRRVERGRTAGVYKQRRGCARPCR